MSDINISDLFDLLLSYLPDLPLNRVVNNINQLSLKKALSMSLTINIVVCQRGKKTYTQIVASNLIFEKTRIILFRLIEIRLSNRVY